MGSRDPRLPACVSAPHRSKENFFVEYPERIKYPFGLQGHSRDKRVSMVTTIVSFFTLWISEHPFLFLFILLPALAFTLSMLTLNTMHELEYKSNLRKKMRFCKLFCGWLALFYFMMCTRSILAVYLMTCLLPLFILFAYHEKTTSPSKSNSHWKYHESIKPIIRLAWKSIFFYSIFIAFMILPDIYPHIISKHNYPITFGALLIASLMIYPHFCSRIYLAILKSPNEYEINKKLKKSISFLPVLMFIIMNNSDFNNMLIEGITSPAFSVLLAITALGYTYVAHGISFSKTYQLNPNLRSIVSYPIAIQSADQSPLNKQQIYDTIYKCCPNCQIYFEQTSTKFRARKAEIIIVDWEECEATQIASKTTRLNMKIIEAITTNVERSEGYQELKVLNFIIERHDDGQIGNVIPIKNKKIIQFKKLMSYLANNLGRIFQSIFVSR